MRNIVYVAGFVGCVLGVVQLGYVSEVAAAAAPSVVAPSSEENPLVSFLMSADGQEAGALEQVKGLVEAGAKVRGADKSGVTPLEAAIAAVPEDGNIDILKYLLENGANVDINVPNSYGETALIYAVDQHSADRNVLRILLENGANVENSDYYGNRVLWVAIFGQGLDTVKFLVEEGKANVNAKNNSGRTPLTAAAQICDLDKVKYLIKKGAKIDLRDDQGKTAADHLRLSPRFQKEEYCGELLQYLTGQRIPQ